MEIKKLINWCNRERQSIEKTIEFWDSEKITIWFSMSTLDLMN